MDKILLLNKEYKATPFTLDEYTDLQKGDLVESIKTLLKTHIPDLNLELPKHYIESCLVQLWDISLAPEAKFNCDNSPKINYSLIDVPEKQGFIYSINGVNIKFRYPRIFEDQSPIDMVANCVLGVVEKDQEISINDLSEVDLERLYSLFSKDMMNHIIKELTSPEIVLWVPCKCGPHKIHGLSNILKTME